MAFIWLWPYRNRLDFLLVGYGVYGVGGKLVYLEKPILMAEWGVHGLHNFTSGNWLWCAGTIIFSPREQE